MTDHQIKKPICFISHATSDGEFASAIQAEIEKVFAGGVHVFCTSSPGAISPGRDWLADIEAHLSTAKAVIALITPISLERPWLWFEVGAVWSRGRDACRVYPVCAAEVDIATLPAPLNRLQALSLGKADDLKRLFQALIEQFGFGNISALRPSAVLKQIPKYKNVKIVEVDLNERALYGGRYTGYSDEELIEVLDTALFSSEHGGLMSSFLSEQDTNREESIKKGKLLHFRQVDRDHDLPPGTSRRLLDAIPIT